MTTFISFLPASGISGESVFACIDQQRLIHQRHPKSTCSIHPLATYRHGGKCRNHEKYIQRSI